MSIEFHNKSAKEAYNFWREVKQTVCSSPGTSPSKQYTQDDTQEEQRDPSDNTCPSESTTAGNSQRGHGSLKRNSYTWNKQCHTENASSNHQGLSRRIRDTWHSTGNPKGELRGNMYYTMYSRDSQCPAWNSWRDDLELSWDSWCPTGNARRCRGSPSERDPENPVWC